MSVFNCDALGAFRGYARFRLQARRSRLCSISTFSGPSVVTQASASRPVVHVAVIGSSTRTSNHVSRVPRSGVSRARHFPLPGHAGKVSRFRWPTYCPRTCPQASGHSDPRYPRSRHGVKVGSNTTVKGVSEAIAVVTDYHPPFIGQAEITWPDSGSAQRASAHRRTDRDGCPDGN